MTLTNASPALATRGSAEILFEQNRPANSPTADTTQASRALRRDAPVVCASCGREVARRARQQRFCSDRCKERGRTRCRKKTDVHASKNEPRYSSSGAPTNPLKKTSGFNGLQRAKSLSSHHIFAPAQVLAVEVFGRTWEHAISSDGIAIQTSRIRPRALVTSAHALGGAP
jgi:hypothetical protein